MDAKKELYDIVQRAKAHEWTPELFIRCRELLGYVDVFNALRANLPPDEYEQFDIAYCDYIRPEGAALNRWLIQNHRKGSEKVKKDKKEVKGNSEGRRDKRHQFAGFPKNW